MYTLKLTLNSTIAAIMALLCAYALGWQHAWWAAMTVWLVIQPNQNLMTGRILARSIGSIVGAIIGAVIILFIIPMSWQLICLGLWLLISNGLGSLFQQHRNYAFVVSSYTAAIVIMFCYFENNLHAELAYTRIFCTLIGVLFCGLWVLPLVPKVKHHSVFENLYAIEIHIQELFQKKSDHTITPKIQCFYFELQRIFQYFHFHQLFAKKDIQPKTFYQMLQQLALIQGFSQPKTRTYFFEMQKKVSDYSLPWHQKIKYFFKHLDLNQHAIHSLHAIVRVMGVYLLTILIWFATDWTQAPLMVMTAILFAALFSSHTYAQQALTDVLKGSLLGAIFGLIFRIFVVPMGDYIWMIMTLLIVLLLGAYLMNQSKTAKMAIDLNMTFLLIAQPLAQVSQQTPDILLECLAILSGIAITFMWFKYGVPRLFRHISSEKRIAFKRLDALKNIKTYQEFIYFTALIRTNLYTQILSQDLTAQEFYAALNVLKNICVVEVEHLPPHTFQESNLQTLMQAVAQQNYLQYPIVQGEQSNVS